MNLRNLFYGVTALLLFIQSLSANERPNFVFVFGDDINKDSLGCYGGKNVPTPNIDRMARDGILFKRAFTSTAMCAPFRQELYSGRIPWRTQALMNHCWSLPDDQLSDTPELAAIRSIPIALKEQGYRVALVGKRHIGPSEAFPFEHLGDFKKNDKGLELIGQFILECCESDTPFCLVVASHDGHTPYETVKKSPVADVSKMRLPKQWLDTPEMRKVLREHLHEIHLLDRLVGKIDEGLKKVGVYDNTLMLFSSEQGSAFPFAKWSCYVDGLSTALIARWPKEIKGGQVYDELVHTTDIAPTFADYAGVKVRPTDYDGVSLRSVFYGHRRALRSYVFGQSTNKGLIAATDWNYPIRSIRSKDYSLIWNPNHNRWIRNFSIAFAYDMLESGLPVKVKKRWEKEIYRFPVVSWIEDHVRTEPVDPEKMAAVMRVFERPEWEFYDLRNDPHELTNIIETDDKQRGAMRDLMKRELMKHLTEYNDSDPVHTESNLTTNKPKKS